MATLTEDIAALAKDERVMWAVKVLRDKGINGVMYDKLIAAERPVIGEGWSTWNEEQLRRLAAWWRTCQGNESFRTALDFCANQLDLALDGELRGFETTTLHQGGKTPHWLT